MKLRAMATLALALACLLTARADTSADADKRLLKDLQYLTSDDLQGRGVDTKGLNAAAEYIAREFEKAGLQPGAGKSYFQSFELTRSAKAGKNNAFSLVGPLGQTIALERDRQFAVSLGTKNGTVNSGIVFAGYGLTADKPSYDDYAGLDVKGKVVVLLNGTPRQATGEVPFPSIDSRIAAAQKRGAAAVVVVNSAAAAVAPGGGRFGGRVGGSDPFPFTTRFAGIRGSAAPLPLLYLKRDWLDRLLVSSLGRTLEDVEKGIDRELKPASAALAGWTCRCQTDIARVALPVKNVVGVLEGSGPLAKETIVVGAHYDHIGMGSGRALPPRKGKGDGKTAPTPRAGPGAPGGVGFPFSAGGGNAVHHGADDNASGTVAVIELARRFGAMKNREGRRLVFIAFTAEEIGLIGSAHYARNPLFPIGDTVTMVNMDMVGRLQGDRLLVSGLGTAKTFPALVDRLNAKHKFQLDKDMAGNGPSDHSSFFAVNVPVINLFTGFHEQYHRPTDRYETINVPGLRRVTEFVGDLMDELRREPSRPLFIRATGSFDRTRTLWAMAPSVGILPKFVDNRDGLLIDGVVTQTPAALAGLKRGDRVIAAGGTPIRDALAFLEASRTWKAGEKVELTLLRDGKEEKVPLQLVQGTGRGTGRPSAFGFTPAVAAGKPGLYVTAMPKDGNAARAGLQEGDRLLTVNGQPVNSLQDFTTIFLGLRQAASTDVVVDRGGKVIKVALRLR